MKTVTIKEICEITGFPEKAISEAGPDGYGTKRPNLFHFWYRELEEHFDERDGAEPGYSYKYRGQFYEKFGASMQKLIDAGLDVIDPIVGSHVHGYFARRVGRGINPSRGQRKI